MPKSTQRTIRGEQLFASRGLAAHALTFAGGILLWFGVYFVVVSAGGWSHAVASSAGGKTRLFIGAIAGIVTGLYFVGAYTRALGSPMLNLLMASMVTVLMPTRIYALGAVPPTPTFAGGWIVQSAALAAGSGVTLVGVILWYRVRFGGISNATEWEDEHFPAGFRLAEVATDDGGVDFEQADYGLHSDVRPSYGTMFVHASVVLGFTMLTLFVLDRMLEVIDSVVLVSLSESPLTIVAIVGFSYVAYLNRKWRQSVEIE